MWCVLRGCQSVYGRLVSISSVVLNMPSPTAHLNAHDVSNSRTCSKKKAWGEGGGGRGADDIPLIRSYWLLRHRPKTRMYILHVAQSQGNRKLIYTRETKEQQPQPKANLCESRYVVTLRRQFTTTQVLRDADALERGVSKRPALSRLLPTPQSGGFAGFVEEFYII